jgi:hypothetical protein
VQVEHLEAAAPEAVAAPAEDYGIEAVGQDAGNQYLPLPPMK